MIALPSPSWLTAIPYSPPNSSCSALSSSSAPRSESPSAASSSSSGASASGDAADRARWVSPSPSRVACYDTSAPATESIRAIELPMFLPRQPTGHKNSPTPFWPGPSAPPQGAVRSPTAAAKIGTALTAAPVELQGLATQEPLPTFSKIGYHAPR